MSKNAIKIYIDSCAINVFYERGVDIVAEFPDCEYKLILTKGVRQEIQDIPEGKPVRKFALALIENPGITEESFYGYSDLERAAP